MVRFSNQLVAEAIQPFWAALQAGEFLTDAAALAGSHRHRGLVWVREAGGVRPRRGRDLQGRCLSFAEREEIALGRAAGESMRQIARRLGRSPSTFSRELRRNACAEGYRATTAHVRAFERAGRPKPAKLATNRRLPAIVEDDLAKRYSPEQARGSCVGRPAGTDAAARGRCANSARARGAARRATARRATGRSSRATPTSPARRKTGGATAR